MRLRFKIRDFFFKYRVLDGYIGILGFVIWYRILATYFSNIIIFSLSTRNLGFTIEYAPRPLLNYNPIEINIHFFKWRFDSNAKARKETTKRVDKMMVEHRREEKIKTCLYEKFNNGEINICKEVK